MTPNEIEAKSFEIIEKEAGEHTFSPSAWEIVRRMIHTTADFEYMDSVRFHPQALRSGIDAIRSGRPIITDTEMARVGIRQQINRTFGCPIRCFINDPAVMDRAAARGATRAETAVDSAVSEMAGGIYVVGNAPTALMRLIDLTRSRKAEPALIVGLPVGFVNAAESKSELLAADYPCITNIGRKGGSNVAAAVVNALSILAAQ